MELFLAILINTYIDTPDNFGYVEKQRLVRIPATTANASVFYKFTRFAKGLKLVQELISLEISGME